MKDYYEVLGVSRDATIDEIKVAYRKQARRLHPDYAGPESEEAFKELSVAYTVLSDQKQRRQYDRGGRTAGAGGAGFGAGEFDFSDIFETMFGMGGFGGPAGPGSRSRRGSDQVVAIEVTLEEVTFGTTKEFPLETFTACESCQGTCCAPGTSPQRCATCGGAGSVMRVQQTLLGNIRTAIVCSDCEGLGQTIPHPCETCAGSGRTRTTRTISIPVEAGIQSGSRIRLREHGEVGAGGGPAGDLYIEVRVQEDPVFARQGNDLITEIRVPMVVAALGTGFDLSTFDGARQITIDPGTQSGDIIRVKGLGVGRAHGYGRGDLLVRVVVMTPTGLDGDQRELLAQFAELTGETRTDSPPVHSGGPFQWIREKLGS